MVKKSAQVPKKTDTPVEAKKGKKEEKVVIEEEAQSGSIADVAMDIEDNETVKQKKENAANMIKAVKKMNAKVKASIERKQIVKAVQALQEYNKKKRQLGATKTQNLLEDEDQFLQVLFTLT